MSCKGDPENNKEIEAYTPSYVVNASHKLNPCLDELNQAFVLLV